METKLINDTRKVIDGPRLESNKMGITKPNLSLSSFSLASKVCKHAVNLCNTCNQRFLMLNLQIRIISSNFSDAGLFVHDNVILNNYFRRVAVIICQVNANQSVQVSVLVYFPMFQRSQFCKHPKKGNGNQLEQSSSFCLFLTGNLNTRRAILQSEKSLFHKSSIVVQLVLNLNLCD